MPTYRISLYPSATWNAETETTDLGAPSDEIATIEAEYPAKACEAAEPTVMATRSETQPRWQRGKKVTLTTYRTCEAALMAWQTSRGLMALVAVPT